MAENSAIEWTTHTFNPWRGCTKISPGCANCYAETMSHRNPQTFGVWGDKGARVVAAESYWRQPLAWDRKAKAAGERHRVFCASLADVFEDWSGPMVDADSTVIWQCQKCGHRLKTSADPACSCPKDDAVGNYRRMTMNDARRRLFDLIYATPNLDWLLLTKRPENAARMMGPDGVGLYAHADGPVPCPQPNVWVGVSVEDQKRADERIRLLLQTPAAVRFLSCEPLLGPVDLTMIATGSWAHGHVDVASGYLQGEQPDEMYDFEADPNGWVRKPAGEWERGELGVDWVIVGGESGPGARPMQVEWARSIVQQCQSAGVACFVKQLGSYATDTARPVIDRRASYQRIPLADRKGGNPAEWPADLRVREFPEVAS